MSGCALTALDPEWIMRAGRIVGVLFVCPVCSAWGTSFPGAHSVAVLFANPPDGGPAVPNDDAIIANYDGRRWTRTGDSFDTLSLSPSIDLTRTRPADWHGFIQNGRAL